jgi:hypothetical protein
MAGMKLIARAGRTVAIETSVEDIKYRGLHIM